MDRLKYLSVLLETTLFKNIKVTTKRTVVRNKPYVHYVNITEGGVPLSAVRILTPGYLNKENRNICN